METKKVNGGAVLNGYPSTKNKFLKKEVMSMEVSIVVTVIGLCASVSSIVFSLLAYKRSERQDQRKEGKSEGLIMSDIGYIKACVDRVEKNLTRVDETYKNVIERLAKVEESVAHITRRVDESQGN